MAYGKLIGKTMTLAPKVLIINEKQYINPPKEIYLACGYLPLEYTTIPEERKNCHLVQTWSNEGDRLLQAWHYEIDKINNSDLQAKINQLEELLQSLKNPYTQITAPVFPEGDYMNPAFLAEGGLISEKNKWYYTTDKNRPHMAIVEGFITPKVFDDKNWFYFT